jgi:hypothetical protein
MPKLHKPKTPKRLDEYAPELRGPSQNRWGGQRTQRLRTYGGKFGKANDSRSSSTGNARMDCDWRMQIGVWEIVHQLNLPNGHKQLAYQRGQHRKKGRT